MGEEQRKIPMHSKASLVKGQVWSSFAAAWEKNKERHVYKGFFSVGTSLVPICSCVGEEQRKIPMHSKASLVKGQIWSSLARYTDSVLASLEPRLLHSK